MHQTRVMILYESINQRWCCAYDFVCYSSVKSRIRYAETADPKETLIFFFFFCVGATLDYDFDEGNVLLRMLSI